MKPLTITFADDEPISGPAGSVLLTEPLKVPCHRDRASWQIYADEFLGQSAFRVTLEVADDPTCWCVVETMEPRDQTEESRPVERLGAAFVRIRIEILQSEDSTAEWAVPLGYMRLTAKLHLYRET